MITIITEVWEGKKRINPEFTFLEDCKFKFTYTKQLFRELCVEVKYEVRPLKDEDSWYLEGTLHGLVVCVFFNTVEDMVLRVGHKKIKGKTTIKETLDDFINLYRSQWWIENN